MRVNTTSVCLPPDQLEYVRGRAERDFIPVSSVIRQLIARAKEQDGDALNGHRDRSSTSSSSS